MGDEDICIGKKSGYVNRNKCVGELCGMWPAAGVRAMILARGLMAWRHGSGSVNLFAVMPVGRSVGMYFGAF